MALDKISPPRCVTDPKWMPICNNNEFLESPFSFLEFNVALESKNAVSACGTDGIDYEILQRLPLKYKLLLLDIFNEMYKKVNILKYGMHPLFILSINQMPSP